MQEGPDGTRVHEAEDTAAWALHHHHHRLAATRMREKGGACVRAGHAAPDSHETPPRSCHPGCTRTQRTGRAHGLCVIESPFRIQKRVPSCAGAPDRGLDTVCHRRPRRWRSRQTCSTIPHPGCAMKRSAVSRRRRSVRARGACAAHAKLAAAAELTPTPRRTDTPPPHAAFGESCSLPVPEIVAIGGQSDGKSSLLEAFLGVRWRGAPMQRAAPTSASSARLRPLACHASLHHPLSPPPLVSAPVPLQRARGGDGDAPPPDRADGARPRRRTAALPAAGRGQRGVWARAARVNDRGRDREAYAGPPAPAGRRVGVVPAHRNARRVRSGGRGGGGRGAAAPVAGAACSLRPPPAWRAAGRGRAACAACSRVTPPPPAPAHHPQHPPGVDSTMTPALFPNQGMRTVPT